MSFTGDHPIVDNILFDVSGSAIALTHSASVDMSTQAGLAIAGVYSGTSGFTARVLQVDEEGRLMVDAQLVPAGVQTVTGSVSISEPVTISQPVAVTDNGGSLTVDDGGGSITVDGAVDISDGGGSITVDGTVTANVTGTVNLDRGNNFANPLFVTGSFNAELTKGDVEGNPLWISGTVAVVQPVAVTDNGGSLTVDGTVTANVTGTVNLDRGNFENSPLWVSGTVSATLSGGDTENNPLWVSGTVAIVQPVAVTDNGGSLTVDDGGGSITVDGTVTANVTGTVNLDRGNFENSPLWVSGTVAIVQPIAVTDNGGSLTVDGTVTANVTGTVNLDRGNFENSPLWISGSTSITNVVRVEDAIHTTASGTFFAATTSPITIAASSITRRGLTIYNESNKAMYIKFGSGASTSDYTYKVFSDDGWIMPDFLYSGIITAVWAGAGSSGAQVTIITP